MHRLSIAVVSLLLVAHADARSYELDGDGGFALWIPIAAAAYAGMKWGPKQAIACGAIGLGVVVAFPVYATIALLAAIAAYFLWAVFSS